ncbi:hypothetical protein BDY24DRAFT_10148 [Mrakia frigida]|uniref:25S rRNA (uracil2634-N3)-methyltransferase n=1 Tax=Mrakia frigida TaxID=29902 RepID=UPI003FCC26AF
MAKKPSLKGALANRKQQEGKIKEAEKKEQRMQASQEASDKKAKAKAKKVMPFEEDDRILLLGEANFSFTHALLVAHPLISPPHQVLATSFDSEETCYLKYPDAKDLVAKVRELGVPVLFEVDAGDLEAVEEIRKMKGGFTKVVFNFPHVGLGEKSQSRNVILNQALILRFLRSVPPFLSQGRSRLPPVVTKKTRSARGKGKGRERVDQDGNAGGGNGGGDDDDLEGVSDLDEEVLMEGDAATGEASTSALARGSMKNQKGVVLITLRDAVPYTLWDLPHLFTRPPPPPPASFVAPALRPSLTKTTLPPTQPKYQILRSFAFHPNLYPGYAHRRTIGFKDGVSKSANEEIEERGGGRTWEAEVLDASLEEEVDEEGTETRTERIERRKKELREEKKKGGNGWKDKRPEFTAPRADKGWNDRGL